MTTRRLAKANKVFTSENTDVQRWENFFFKAVTYGIAVTVATNLERVSPRRSAPDIDCGLASGTVVLVVNFWRHYQHPKSEKIVCNFEAAFGGFEDFERLMVAPTSTRPALSCLR